MTEKWLGSWVSTNHMSTKQFSVDKDNDSLTFGFDIFYENGSFQWDIRIGTAEGLFDLWYKYMGFGSSSFVAGSNTKLYKLNLGVGYNQTLWIGMGLDDSQEARQSILRNMIIDTSGLGTLLNHD